MEDRGLRDIERWRDKIEVRLDNRQVFFLFFGSALVACMLFVLGVIVGKRLESRGRAVAPEIEDPLALLDKVASSPKPAQPTVTFPQALFGAGAKTDKHAKKANGWAGAVGPADDLARKQASLLPESKSLEVATKTTVATEKAPAGEKPLAKLEGGTGERLSDKPQGKEAKPAEKPQVDKAVVVAKPQAEKPQADKAVVVAKPQAEKPQADKVALAKPIDKTADPKAAKAKPAAGDGKTVAPVLAAAAPGENKGKTRFALQLSSFQTKAEAEAFAQKFENERPYMVVSDIPGKGIWYRVRVGDYASAKDAMVAKSAFEKKHNVIAYVAQR